ncbi:MAG: hypothetical protein HC834_06350, partial [Rhodospirillales bacterium]|nr:hypothetical protein [Rhodospirillales bacterium]
LLGAEWVLWLLVVLSVLSVYVMIERGLFFRGVSGADREIRRNLVAALGDGDLASAKKQVEHAVGPGGRMVREMLHHAGKSGEAIDAAMNAVRPEEKIRLERNLSFLGTLGANAPFIGLFGTVLGIIKAFKDLAESGCSPAARPAPRSWPASPRRWLATAIGLLVAASFLTPLLHFLPKATLAATIVVAVLSLVDFKTPRAIWRPAAPALRSKLMIRTAWCMRQRPASRRAKI